MRNKQRPWLPETSGEYAKTPAVGYEAQNLEGWEREWKKRSENERVLHPNDGYYRDSDGMLCEVKNGPYVNGRQWARLQRKDYY